MPDTERRAGDARSALGFATCTLIWGSTFLFIRIGNDTMPPVWAATLRLALASAILTLLVRLVGRRLPRGDALRAALGFGFFQFGINMPLLYWGETVVPSGLAAVVFATIPVTSALLARAFGLERLVPAKLVAAGVALAGVAVLFSHELSARVTVLPVLSVYLATVAAAFGTIMLKRGPRQDPMGANAVGAAVGAVMSLMVSFLMREPHPLPTTGPQILPILYLAVAGSVVAFVVMAWLVHRWDVSSIAFIGVAVPVIAVSLGVLVRHESFQREHLIGSVLVMAAVALVIVSDRGRSRRSP
jgi:drug/metabolite transporter (DMT)-like permease